MSTPIRVAAAREDVPMDAQIIQGKFKRHNDNQIVYLYKEAARPMETTPASPKTKLEGEIEKLRDQCDKLMDQLRYCVSIFVNALPILIFRLALRMRKG